MSQHYEGSCHCGAIKFSYDGEEITQGLRCTCSICARKGAMMSAEAIPLEALAIEANPEDIGLYEFDSKVAGTGATRALDEAGKAITAAEEGAYGGERKGEPKGGKSSKGSGVVVGKRVKIMALVVKSLSRR